MAAQTTTEGRDYPPPDRRPKKGEKVHQHPTFREGPVNGEVIAVLRAPEMSDRKAEQFTFVVRWWIPWKRRYTWSCHSPFEWELGSVRPGHAPRPKKKGV